MARISFKETVIEHFGKNWRKKLQKQYDENGVKWLERYWGFSDKTIANNLSKLGIKVYKKGWARWQKKLEDAVNKKGGLEKLIHRYKSKDKIAEELGVSRTAMYNLLKRKGWEWNKNERRWYRPHE